MLDWNAEELAVAFLYPTSPAANIVTEPACMSTADGHQTSNISVNDSGEFVTIPNALHSQSNHICIRILFGLTAIENQVIRLNGRKTP